MISFSLRNLDGYPIRIDEQEGISGLCLASQSDTPRRTAYTSFRPRTRRREICHSPSMRTHSLSRAGVESSRARVPYIARWEFPPATTMRPAALQSKRSRYLPAYVAV